MSDPNFDVLVRVAHDMGIKLVVERAFDCNSLHLKAHLPVQRCHATIAEDDLLLCQGTALSDLFLRTIEGLQRRVFDEAHEHLEKHDITGQCDSLKRITLQACELALKHVPPSHPEYQEIEHCLEYIEHLNAKKER